jgi:hypothetical protein
MGAVAWKPLEAAFRRTGRILHLHFPDGERIRTTPEHPFSVEGKGWTPAGNTRNGNLRSRNPSDRPTCSLRGKGQEKEIGCNTCRLRSGILRGQPRFSRGSLPGSSARFGKHLAASALTPQKIWLALFPRLLWGLSQVPPSSPIYRFFTESLQIVEWAELRLSCWTGEFFAKYRLIRRR